MRHSNARQRRRALAVIRLGEADDVLGAWQAAAQRLAGPGAHPAQQSHAAAQLRAAEAWRDSAAQALREAE